MDYCERLSIVSSLVSVKTFILANGLGVFDI